LIDPRFDRTAVSGLLDQMVAAGAVTAAVALVGEAERVLWSASAGREAGAGSARARPATPFDFASLTKPIVATLALVLDRQDVLPLATRVGDLWPRAHRDLARRQLSDLLRHRSGLLAWTPLYHRCRDRAEALELLLGGALLGAKPDTYSDLGYLLYGMAVEAWTGATLAELLFHRLELPLWLDGVLPRRRADLTRAAQCRLDTTREVELAAAQGFAIAPLGPPARGEAQDGNARFLIAGGDRCEGHAGLFGRAHDLHKLAREWLRPRRMLSREGVAAALAGGGRYALGWERAAAAPSAGPTLGPRAFGHTGFTGGSLWIDPDGGGVFVLLAHRTDPARDMNPFRRRFHALVQRPRRDRRSRAPEEEDF
jgi:CubicO group peptidase (beta-lactamase class C family)